MNVQATFGERRRLAHTGRVSHGAYAVSQLVGTLNVAPIHLPQFPGAGYRFRTPFLTGQACDCILRLPNFFPDSSDLQCEVYERTSANTAVPLQKPLRGAREVRFLTAPISKNKKRRAGCSTRRCGSHSPSWAGWRPVVIPWPNRPQSAVRQASARPLCWMATCSRAQWPGQQATCCCARPSRKCATDLDAAIRPRPRTISRGNRPGAQASGRFSAVSK